MGRRQAASALFFHDPGTRLGVGDGPVEDPVLEQLVEKIAAFLGEAVPAPAGSERADAAEDVLDGRPFARAAVRPVVSVVGDGGVGHTHSQQGMS